MQEVTFLKKIAILYLCTGEYIVLWNDFFRTFEQNFLTNCEKHYFVFTDAEKILYADKCNRIHKCKNNYVGWPLGTLMRFEIFLTIEEELQMFDYIFFMNANLRCIQNVSEEEFLLENDRLNSLIVAEQPQIVSLKKYPQYFPYERNPKSKAYIPYNLGKYYVMGAINGGKSKAYLELIHTLQKNIQIDLDNKITAVVLDESHLNRYIVNRNDVKVLSPAYCNFHNHNYEEKIILEEKGKYFDVKAIKKFKKHNLIYKVIKKSWYIFKCNIMLVVDKLLKRSIM